MGLLRRLSTRLRGPSKGEEAAPAPPGLSFARARPGGALPDIATALPLLDSTALLQLLAQAPRPLLIAHLASWDEGSLELMPELEATFAPFGDEIDRLVLGWDRFVSAPMPRIAPMATRAARWADGSDLRAWLDQRGPSWEARLFDGSAEELVAACSLERALLPQLSLHRPGGERLHYLGPPGGPGWAEIGTS